MAPFGLEILQQLLNRQDKEDATFGGSLFASSLKGYVCHGGAAPDVRGNGVSDELACQVEGEDGVHGVSRRAWRIVLWWMVSKAFLRSTLRMVRGRVHSRCNSMVSWMV